jgi:hypothetical protein
MPVLPIDTERLHLRVMRPGDAPTLAAYCWAHERSSFPAEICGESSILSHEPQKCQRTAPTYAGGVDSTQLVVGFDLDMTLIDTVPGFGAVLEALGAELGVTFPVLEMTKKLGPPLETLLSGHLDEEAVGPAGDRFRELYPAYAIDSVPVLEGAHEAIAAVRRHGGRVLVSRGIQHGEVKDRRGTGHVPAHVSAHAVGDDGEVASGIGRVIVLRPDPAHIGPRGETKDQWHRVQDLSSSTVLPMRMGVPGSTATVRDNGLPLT